MPGLQIRDLLPRAGRLLPALVLALSFRCAHADIVIGQVTPLTGPQAVTGKAILAGVQLYFDAVNARGGVRGQRLKLVVRDDAQNTTATVREVNALIRQEAPVALIGTVGTSNLEALASDGVLTRSHVPMVGAISGAASVAAADRMYVVKARYQDEVDRLFANLQHAAITRVGIVYQDDGLGRDVVAGATQSAARRGISVVGSGSYPRNTTDTAAAVARMIAARPDAIFLGATTAAAAEFLMRYRLAGGSALVYGMSIIDPDVLFRRVGPAFARGYAYTLVLPSPTDTQLAVVREYDELRRASRIPDLSTRSMEGFIAAKTLVWALKRATRIDSDAVAEALAAPGGFDTGDFVVDFSQKSRTGSRYIDFAMFGQDGLVVR
jgi:ABC-type branched-subunit amino acid transport system substrate-binding protein